MRDLMLIAGLGSGMLVALRRPWVGALLWVLVGVLNPHRMGYAVSAMPVAAAVAGAVLLGILVSRPPFSLPRCAPVLLLVLLSLWMCVTYAMSPANVANHDMAVRVVKIYVMVFVVLGLLVTRVHVDYLVWVLVLSLGVYGVKGGLFTLATGGSYKVWGPEGSFIEGNNELALALVMAIPLMLYLRSASSGKWVSRALLAAALLCAVSALGSHSRGALLAICAVSGLLWLRSSRKFLYGLMLFGAGAVVMALMPSAWSERMSTISTYDQDASAMGRINAWWMAWNAAKGHPFGIGFETATRENFALYAPDPSVIQGPHSIYFEVLGSHGFIGLALFLGFWAAVWATAARVRRMAGRPGHAADPQAAPLAAMVQASLVGYFVGGAFLGLAYFDVPYYLAVIAIRLRKLMDEPQKAALPSGAQPAAAGGSAGAEPVAAGSPHPW